MAIGNFFNKFRSKNSSKEENLLPDEITLWNLKKGYMLDYELRTWEVKGVYEYDWGRSGKSTEYKIHDGTEFLYLHVNEHEGEQVISVAEKIKIADLQGSQAKVNHEELGFQVKSKAVTTSSHQEIRNSISKNNTPPKEVVFQNETYYMSEESEGFFRDLDERERFRFIEWSYNDSGEEKFVTISRWSETELEVYAGIYLQDFEISNLLPR